MSTTTDTLTHLHDHYVEAVNMAVADGDDARVARLAAEFDLEALDVVRRPDSPPPEPHPPHTRVTPRHIVTPEVTPPG